MSTVKIYQMNECDAVAAKSEEEAKEFYLKQTGLSVEDAFPEPITEVSLKTKVWESETLERKIALSSIVERYWTGEPFIATTKEW